MGFYRDFPQGYIGRGTSNYPLILTYVWIFGHLGNYLDGFSLVFWCGTAQPQAISDGKGPFIYLHVVS